MSIKDWREKINPVVSFGKARSALGTSIAKIYYRVKLPWEAVKDRFTGEGANERYFTAAVVILVGFSSFGLGRLSVTEEKREPILIERKGEKQNNSIISAAKSTLPQTQTAAAAGSFKDATPPAPMDIGAGGKLVASKNGTKYHFPWCGGAARIAEQNKIWFNSEAEARAKGYTPAANCKGLR